MINTTIEDLVKTAEEYDTSFLRICPICGNAIKVFHQDEAIKIHCIYDDINHSIFREDLYFFSQEDAINDWNNYCYKILALRKNHKTFFKNAYRFLIASYYIVFPVLVILNVLLLICIIGIILAFFVLLKFVEPRIFAILGSDYVQDNEQTKEIYRNFLANYKTILLFQTDSYTRDLLKKLKHDNASIEKLASEIKDEEIIETISHLVQTSNEIYNYLIKDLSKASRAITFVNSYQQGVLYVVEDYLDLVSMPASRFNEDLIDKIKTALKDARYIYQDEYDAITRSSIDEIKANLKVLQETMKGH